MYQAHWGFAESPFRAGRGPLYLHRGQLWDEALARMEFLVEHRRRMGLLLAEAGVGKSLLLEELGRSLRARGVVVAPLSLVGVGEEEFPALVAEQLGAATGADASAWQIWRRLSDKLSENRYQQLHTVLLLDDADEARPAALEQVARLVQLDVGAGPSLTTIVSAQLARVGRLGARLLELVELRIDLEPWDAADTAAYVRAALAASGVAGEVFTDQALLRLHELSGGAARRVTQLANLALVAGAGRRLKQIDADSVATVCHELAAVAVD